jgi:hypothetical protein
MRSTDIGKCTRRRPETEPIGKDWPTSRYQWAFDESLGDSASPKYPHTCHFIVHFAIHALPQTLP